MSASKLKRGPLESTIEDYFVEQVEAAGGMALKLKDVARKGFPDRTAIWPAYGWARIHFIELKTIGGALESWQKRYHADLRKKGALVLTLWTKKQVDDYVREYCVPF
jgi:hypothetical protein